MDENRCRWALGLSEMINLEDVKSRFSKANHLWFDETVKDLHKLYSDQDIHFPSFVAGYLEVMAEIKETYKKEPLLVIESLDGNLPKEFGVYES